MLKFALTRGVHEPTRGTSKSAGIDLYIPTLDEAYEKDFLKFNPDHQQAYIDRGIVYEGVPTYVTSIVIWPHCAAFIPTGLKVFIPEQIFENGIEGTALIVRDKGGVSLKNRVTKLAGLIDEDFQGEMFITMLNYSNKPAKLEEGKKFIQIIRVPVYYDRFKIVPEADLYSEVTARGEGMMGSTG
jgi:dUTPase